MTAASDNPFWDFSLTVYVRPGVADSCLALQDRLGLDVNLLLFCCWMGSQGRRLDSVALARLMTAVGDWQRSIVGPLRAVRRCLKELPDGSTGRAGALRQAVKDCELAAERIEQTMLHDAVAQPARTSGPAGQEAACASANLRTYLQLVGAPISPEDRADLERILVGTCGNISEDSDNILF